MERLVLEMRDRAVGVSMKGKDDFPLRLAEGLGAEEPYLPLHRHADYQRGPSVGGMDSGPQVVGGGRKLLR